MKPLASRWSGVKALEALLLDSIMLDKFAIRTHSLKEPREDSLRLLKWPIRRLALCLQKLQTSERPQVKAISLFLHARNSPNQGRQK